MEIILPDTSKSYWRTSVALETFPKLNETITVDVGIVGAGITGITTAYLLAKQGLSVCVVEGNKILDGTTGHTTAKITAQHGVIYHELIEHFGLDIAKLYYEANNNAKIFMENLINENKIDCDFTSENAYIITNQADQVLNLENEKQAYDKLGIESELMEDGLPLSIPYKSLNDEKSSTISSLKISVLSC